jgi:hypothetical protein
MVDQTSADRAFNVFVYDRHSRPIEGALVRLFVDGRPILEGTTQGYDNTPLSFKTPALAAGQITITATFGDKSAEARPDPLDRNISFTLDVEARADMTTTSPSRLEKFIGIVAGIVFLVVLLVIAIAMPHPTEFQILVFRIVLSLAAAGFAATIPGFLHVATDRRGLAIRAGGALAVFVIVFFFNPPELVTGQTRPTEQVEIPTETGWIFVGYYNVDREFFTEGPYVELVSTATPGRRLFVEKGDRVRLKVDRKVIIPDYQSAGAKNNLMSPIEKGVITASDETRVTLPRGTELLVRDVSAGKWPGAAEAALWIRVVEPPS